MTYKLSLAQIRAIKSFCSNLHSNPNWRDVVEMISLNSGDFEIDNVRFIHDREIRDILEDELAADEYMLGCFNPWAIHQATGWPEFLIELAQESDNHKKLGAEMTGEHIAELASILVQYDGYGHYFNHYDGSQEELHINGIDGFWYVFDNR